MRNKYADEFDQQLIDNSLDLSVLFEHICNIRKMKNIADKKYQEAGKVGRKHFGICYANLYEMLPQIQKLSKDDIKMQES